MIWNSKNTTYYSKGKKVFGFGDELPPGVIEQMGKGTFDEYVEKGWIDDGTAAAPEPEVEAVPEVEKFKPPEPDKPEPIITERDALFSTAKSLGLKPHYRAGIAKLKEMVEDHEALQALKSEALALGIDPSDDIDFAELTELVDEKKAENDEPDPSE